MLHWLRLRAMQHAQRLPSASRANAGEPLKQADGQGIAAIPVCARVLTMPACYTCVGCSGAPAPGRGVPPSQPQGMSAAPDWPSALKA